MTNKTIKEIKQEFYEEQKAFAIVVNAAAQLVFEKEAEVEVAAAK